MTFHPLGNHIKIISIDQTVCRDLIDMHFNTTSMWAYQLTNLLIDEQILTTNQQTNYLANKLTKSNNLFLLYFSLYTNSTCSNINI